ncbi:MAG: DUF2946 domain-containing protein [Burkholderiales bacterium]|nr:DUF2946 domain-containing protein [Burkholderiales bacterium]OJX06329.1 MAG: hypothetical protein BGO72_10395 [Burkholderiales bacterium 70-64]
MNLAVVQRARIAWLVLAAMLMSALAPGISHALLAGPAGPSLAVLVSGDVCSIDAAGGAGAAQVAGGQAAPHAPSGEHDGDRLEHCPYCLTHAFQHTLPAGPSAAPPAAAATLLALPRLHPPAPATPLAWRTAHPRAPPLSA